MIGYEEPRVTRGRGTRSRMRIKNICAALILILALVRPAISQCQPSWLEGQATPTTKMDSSSVVFPWDPDGSGPQTQVLLFGGFFRFAGGMPANYIATWDGATRTWGTLGSGPNGQVTSFAVYNGSLITAGNFVSADGNDAIYLKRWDGANWLNFGTGPNGHVNALLNFGGELIVAGSFSAIDGVFTRSVAAWNGTTWRTVGFPVMFVSALGVLNGELYATTTFPSHSLVKWNPTSSMWDVVGTFSFTPLPSGGVYVQSIIGYKNELIVGGAFDHVDAVAVDHIAAFNPATSTWRPLGSGLTSSSTISRVQSMIVVGDDLLVGGDYTAAGGQTARDIARWNGTTNEWTPLGTGTTTPGSNAAINSICEYRGEIIAAGFFQLAGGVPSINWARWGLPTLETLAPRTTCHNGTPTASIRGTGVSAGGFSFQWRKNEVPIDPIAEPRFVITASADAQTSTLTLTPPTAADLDPGVRYDCVMTFDCGSLTTQPVTLSGCPGDVNCSGDVTVDDIFLFLDAYFRADPLADYDGNPGVSVQDLFTYLAAYFTGCP